MITVLFLAEHFDFVHIDDILPVATDKTAALETLFHGLQPATQHVFLQVLVAVFVPDYYVIVVRLNVIQA